MFEKRRRVVIGGTEVFFRADQVHGFDREYVRGAGEDLSVGGMFVATRSSMPVASLIRLMIFIPFDVAGEPPVTCRAVVRWRGARHGGSRGMGVQFLEFKGLGELRLTAWLDTILAKPVAEAGLAGHLALR